MSKQNRKEREREEGTEREKPKAETEQRVDSEFCGIVVDISALVTCWQGMHARTRTSHTERFTPQSTWVCTCCLSFSPSKQWVLTRGFPFSLTRFRMMIPLAMICDDYDQGDIHEARKARIRRGMTNTKTKTSPFAI